MQSDLSVTISPSHHLLIIKVKYADIYQVSCGPLVALKSYVLLDTTRSAIMVNPPAQFPNEL